VIKSLQRARKMGYVGCVGEERNAYRVLVGKPLGRPRSGWEDNIQMYLQDITWRGID
jgi:hypothetical protein